MTIFYLLLGTFFGFVLSRSGAADYDFIQGMFLFQRFQLYGIIGTAVALTAPGLWLLKRYGQTLGGKGGLIAVAPNGDAAWGFTTPAMYRGMADASGRTVRVYSDEDER